jgi:t-SNARE complex subunit (syntaxin)
MNKSELRYRRKKAEYSAALKAAESRPAEIARLEKQIEELRALRDEMEAEYGKEAGISIYYIAVAIEEKIEEIISLRVESIVAEPKPPTFPSYGR